MDDARKPFRSVAKKIGISTQTVIKRYNKMKAKGTIQKCSIAIDLKKIGYEGTAFLLITGSPSSNLTETINQIKNTQNIIVATKAIGDYEGYAVLPFKSPKDLFERVQNIKKLPNIEKVEVSIAVPDIQTFPILNTKKI